MANPVFSPDFLHPQNEQGGTFERDASPEDLVRINYVSVPDKYEHEPERQEILAQFAEGEKYLREHPEIGIASEENYPKAYLDRSPTIESWRSMMPSAKALYPLQRPEDQFLPNGIEVDEWATKLFKHGPDAIGIRSRAEIMKQVVLDAAGDKDHVNWMSLACGAAVPVLDAVKGLPSETDVKLQLVDYDNTALDFADHLASKQGLTRGKEYELLNVNLVKDLVVSQRLVEKVGAESQDVVDMLGIFEYFDEKRAAKLLTNAYELVAPGGIMIIGNMLDSHPTLEINRRAVGWPNIFPRSLSEITSILEQANIPLGNVDVYIPEDNVYAVVEISKPVELQLVQGDKLD